jgi:hypothetical protein
MSDIKEIGHLEITDNKKLVLSVGEYRGEERVDLRQNVLVKEIWRPTKKGINFNLEWIDKFIKMVEKLKDI